MSGGRRSRVGGCRSGHTFFESLEPRRLLSAGPGIVVHPGVVSRRAAVLPAVSPAASSAIDGFTPSQTRQAYGFDQASFANGTVPADGRGQTIAIVDPYDDPQIAADLAIFDAQFGLPAPPQLKVVNQTGGTKLPPSDAGWAGEISLDVEWAHAIAPQANLLLVEADSDSLTDLLAGVGAARGAAGVSVVSMSWGGSEFFGFNGRVFTGETTDDTYFLTPAGHTGVTFVTAAGDNGAAAGAGYPGESPNVLSVGGTTLTLQDQSGGSGSGAYGSEVSWDQTGGGYSQIEPESDFQKSAQDTGARSTPDVAYNANPDTGFAVYDSVPYQGVSGWQDIGGNSAGTPQWAALVAIADQGRALAGKGTLDGATQTLPALYGLYGAPGTPAYSSYTSYFNDTIDTTNGQPSTGLAATTGYDTATGLGSPKADHVIGALVATTVSSPSSPAPGPSSPTPTPSPSPAPTPLPASPLAGAFATSPPAAVIDGDKGSLKLRLTDTGGSRFAGPVSVKLFASTAAALSTDAAAVTTLSIPQLRLRPGASKTVTLRFTYPTGLPNGSYYLIASVDATGSNTAPAEPVTAVPVKIASPQPDLATTFAGNVAVSVTPGRHANATLTVQNLGNLKSSATFSGKVYASPNPAADASAQLLVALPPRKMALRPGQSKSLRVRFLAPKGQPGGAYYLVAVVTTSQPPGNQLSNHVAAIGTLGL